MKLTDVLAEILIKNSVKQVLVLAILNFELIITLKKLL